MSETRDRGLKKDQAGQKPEMDRRKAHEARQVAAGFTRCIVRCHKDDVAEIKKYAAGLLEKRQGSI